MRRGSGINKGTDAEQSAKRRVGACESRRFRGSPGFQGVQGGSMGGFRSVGKKTSKTRKQPGGSRGVQGVSRGFGLKTEK